MVVAVIGGGPAGATAALTLAKAGVETYLIEKELNGDKPCGGGIPYGVFKEFGLSESLIERKVSTVGIIAPSGYEVIAELGEEYIGMVDRAKLDPHLREKAKQSEAKVIEGIFTTLSTSKKIRVCFRQGQKEEYIEADYVIAADGANSSVAKQIGAERPQVYLTVQEKVELTGKSKMFYGDRCEFWYGSDISPNFYGWVFPKGNFATIGTGAPYNHGRFMDGYMARLKERLGDRVDGAKILKRQAFSLPLGSVVKKVYGNILLAGDAAGTVMPVSGEGIYYGMASGRLAAEAVIKGDPAFYEREWKKVYGSQFKLMSLMRRIFYRNDKWRERLVRMHEDKDAQKRALALWLDKEKGYPTYSVYWKMVKSLLKHL